MTANGLGPLEARKFTGAALTARPIVGDAWRRCCLDVGISRSRTSAEVTDLLAGSAHARHDRLVVLVDHPLGTTDNLAALRPRAAALLLLAPTMMSTALRSSLGAGVDGLVTVGDPLARVREALTMLVADESYVSPAAAHLLLAEHRDRSQRRAAPTEVTLSLRERQVLQAMTDGLTTKATARRLGIAVKTAEAHRARLFTRLQVRSRAEAVTRALTDPRLLAP